MGADPIDVGALFPSLDRALLIGGLVGDVFNRALYAALVLLAGLPAYVDPIAFQPVIHRLP